MRLLFINERLGYANATSYGFDLATELIARGDEVQLCTAGGELEPAFREAGIQTYIVKWNLLCFRKLISFLRDFDPDLIHIQSLRSVPFGRRLARKLGKPWVVTAHTRPSPDAARLDDPMLCGAIATSEVIRASLVNDLDAQKNFVRVIPRGIDIHRFPQQAGQVWSAESGRLPVVGSVGRLTRDKGHHVLIEAARLVLDAGVEAHFAFVGDGEDEPALRKRVKELDLVPHVTFSPHIPGQVRLYDVFDIIAMPVLNTGVGVTAIEAMAMRKPLITSGVGELLHLVQDGVTGFVVGEGDAKGLAEQIITLLRDPDLMRSIGESAREWVEHEFALSPMVDETQRFYASCLEALAERLETP